MEQTVYAYEIEYDVIEEDYVYSYSGNILFDILLTEDEKDVKLILEKVAGLNGIGIDNVEIKSIKLLPEDNLL